MIEIVNGKGTFVFDIISRNIVKVPRWMMI